jgi:hypothetical protein
MKKREIPALLRPKMMDLDYSVLAEMIRQQGRGRDKILAHITPDEARLLKQRGGRGSINPTTGLPEFQEDFYGGEDYIGDPTDIAAGAEDLYPGGVLPGAGQETVFAPGGESAYQPVSYEPPAMQQGGYPPAAFPIKQDYGLVPSGAPSSIGLRAAPALGLRESPVGLQPGLGGGTALGEATAPQKGFFDELGRETREYFKSPTNVLRALGIAGTGLMGAMQARRAGRQSEAMSREFRDIGAPYRAMGQQLVSAGQRGELTAPQQQALQQVRAQTQQQLARAGIRGGTAAMQSEAAIQRQAEQFAQQNINEGIKLLNIADQYTSQGIRAAYQADADARNLALRFFTAATQQIPQSAPGAVRTVPTGV